MQDIRYHCCDYRTRDLEKTYDLITRIDYDFGVRSLDDRRAVLRRAWGICAPEDG